MSQLRVMASFITARTVAPFERALPAGLVSMTNGMCAPCAAFLVPLRYQMSNANPTPERRCKQCGHLLNGWAGEFCSDWCRKVWYSGRLS